MAIVCISSFVSLSQTQSLWSQIKKDKSDIVGLNALQYQAPLWGPQISFFDQNVVKGINDYAQVDTWLVRDFNNDGFADIFLTFSVAEERTPAPFILLIYDKNTGKFKDESYRLKNNIGQTDTRKSMSADFNGDGILDVVAVSHPECNSCNLSYFDIILSNPDTTWTQKSLRVVDRFKCEGYNHGVAVGDIDNDGDIDIILANENSCSEGSISYINDGKGNFIPKPVSTIDRGKDFVTNAWTTELADVNKDGCLDLLYWHDEKNTRILYGNCKDRFDNTYQDLGPLKYPYVMDYDVRDLDGDGDLDLILTTTNYSTGWQIVFLENKGNDSTGKVIWVDHSSSITQSLKNQGFYPDGDPGTPYIHLADLNSDGNFDIISQNPLSNTDKYFGQWILLGDGNWNFKYKKLPFAEPPKAITSTFVNGKVNISWDRVKQSYSTSDGGINKWAIYISDKSWGDRSQVSKPIILQAKETLTNSGSDQYALNPTTKEMYIRISPIDSTGIEWPLSTMLKISILPPSITSATICDGNSLTISGNNFVEITKLSVGGKDVLSYTFLSDRSVQAVLNSGQTGIVSITTVAGNVTFSDVKFVVPTTQPFTINGKKSPLKGEIETYSVPESLGVSFMWSFPDGWGQTSGGNSNSVTVRIGTNGGTIQVIPSAICGNLKPISLPVTVYTYIPDDNFQKALRDLGIDTGNKPDSVLSSSLFNIPELNVDSKNISDLTGIQDFESLKNLYCRSNNIKSLDMTNNRLLEGLFCTKNEISNLVLTNNAVLKVLFCDENKLSTLDISKNFLLFSVGCGINSLTTLNVSQNRELGLLSMVNNPISSIDLSKSTKLFLFHSWDTKLSNIDLSNNMDLKEIDINSNQLSRLDLSKNTKLTTVRCVNNKLVSLNLRNGNNGILKIVASTTNPNLACIEVDNSSMSTAYPDWTKDVTASYSENCPPIITSISPANPCKGYVVTISGANFDGVSSISFGGIKVTSFSVLSSTSISAVIGDGSSGILTVTNSLGTATYSGIQIGQLPAVVGAITGLSTVCQGQSSVSYSVPAIPNVTSYSWTLPNGITGTSTSNNITVNVGTSAVSGNITVKGHNDCGDGTASLLGINVNPLPFTPIITSNGTIIHSDALNGNQWYNQNNLITGATTQDFTITSVGEYTVKVTLNGCTSNVSNMIKDITTAIDSYDNSKKIKVFPNPVSDDLTVEYIGNLDEMKYEIFSSSGQLITSGIFRERMVVHTSSLSDGVYVIKFSSGKSFEFRKVIKH